MGLISTLFGSLFGGGRNIVTETVEVFRPNAEAQAQRSNNLNTATLNQMAAEFADRGERGWFDRVMDGVNRLPRPMMVIGVFGILFWTSIDPIAAAKVFTSWAIIPAEFWYVVLAIVTFYFGGRHQSKANEMQERLASVAVGVPAVIESLAALDGLRPEDHDTPGAAQTGTDVQTEAHATEPTENAALTAWRDER